MRQHVKILPQRLAATAVVGFGGDSHHRLTRGRLSRPYAGNLEPLASARRDGQHLWQQGGGVDLFLQRQTKLEICPRAFGTHPCLHRIHSRSPLRHPPRESVNRYVAGGFVHDEALVPLSVPPGNRFPRKTLIALVESTLLPEAPPREMADLGPHVDPALIVLDDLQRGRAIGVSGPLLGAAVFGENLLQSNDCVYTCWYGGNQSHKVAVRVA